MDKIIGRDSELGLLDKYNKSGRSEFVALYGRRRVGKTSLVRYYFKDRFDFYVTGVLDGTKADQEAAFYDALIKYGYSGEKPKNWKEALNALGAILEKKKKKKRCVIFIDELPCFDADYSGFVKDFGDFWNRMASWYDNIFLIICGSATAWMIRNVIDSKGGLHNRVTHEMHLRPFDLYQTEQYVKARKGKWDRLSILQMYMALGGIPYYFSLVDFSKSPAENIDALFFSQDAELKKEYRRLYKSLYKNPDQYLEIINVLANSRKGMTRKEILTKLKLTSGRMISERLEDLVLCDFISYHSNGGKENSGIYRLVDFYTLFYLTFCKNEITDRAYWRHTINTPVQNTWYGLAFERVCMCHIWQIIQALRLDSMLTKYYSWRSKQSEIGAQIDLVIERADGIIDVCEMKYSRSDYKQDIDDSRNLVNKIDDFVSETKTKKSVQTVLVTTYGLREGAHADDFQKILTLNHLFTENME
ncbi:MAG: ATP-binding protein [Firmicutes bacterium]|nr:ATP-binding protein [Bacillota bacterium]